MGRRQNGRMEREIIVVGAGPTGAAAAALLAQAGHDVLLLDRQTFPRDKSCGDGIPASAIELLFDLGMRQTIVDAGFYEVDRLTLHSPQGHCLSATLRPGPQGGRSCIVPRRYFDALIQRHAVGCGAEFQLAHVEEPILQNNRVVGVRAQVGGATKELRARLVVAADGATSVIARALRGSGHQDHHRAVALRAYVEDVQERPHEVEVFLCRDLLPGYAWMFPLGDGRANVGVGMRLDHFRRQKRTLKDMLRAFLDLPAIRSRLKQGGIVRDDLAWQLNFGSQKSLRHAYDGALLAGDAAGLINPLTGGGIHNALLSARLAAEVADEALARNDVTRASLGAYDERCRQRMWRSLRRAYLVQRMVFGLPPIADWLVVLWTRALAGATGRVRWPGGL